MALRDLRAGERAPTAGRRPPRLETRTFTGVPASVAAARAFVRAQVADDSTADVASLLVSELATNTVQHARTRFDVEVRAGTSVRVAVRDWARRVPVADDCHLTADHGRGLRIVETLARTWGVQRASGGKVVWFEIRP